MPAEWETHEATWLAWPNHPTDWPDKLDTIRWVYTEIVRKITPGEIVRLLVNSALRTKKAPPLPEPCRCRPAPRRVHRPPDQPRLDARQRPALCPPLGKTSSKPPSCISISTPGPSMPTGRRTAACPRQPPARLRKRLFDAQVDGRPFVLEGGGIEVNGRGTLITTEECYLSRRNRFATRASAVTNLKQHCANTSA